MGRVWGLLAAPAGGSGETSGGWGPELGARRGSSPRKGQVLPEGAAVRAPSLSPDHCPCPQFTDEAIKRFGNLPVARLVRGGAAIQRQVPRLLFVLPSGWAPVWL